MSTRVERVVTHVYRDPVDAIWLQLAHEIGWTIERSSEVYASTDGEGTLTLGTDDTLDADDCLAQMIAHEICHACVQGELGKAPDWGLDNTTDRDVEREHACLHLQAALCDAHGLRDVLAPTTDFRAYYDAIGPDPLAGETTAIQLAIEGERWLSRQPWAPRFAAALAATAQIAEVARDFAIEPSASGLLLWNRLGSPTKGSRNPE